MSTGHPFAGFGGRPTRPPDGVGRDATVIVVDAGAVARRSLTEAVELVGLTPRCLRIRRWHLACTQQHEVRSWLFVDCAKEDVVLYYCEFTWFPGTTRAQAAERVVRQHDAGENHPERIKGWYNLVGGGAGFLIVDYDDPREVTAFLQPYMDLMSFDVRAITENPYDESIAQLREVAGSAT